MEKEMKSCEDAYAMPAFERVKRKFFARIKIAGKGEKPSLTKYASKSCSRNSPPTWPSGAKLLNITHKVSNNQVLQDIDSIYSDNSGTEENNLDRCDSFRDHGDSFNELYNSLQVSRVDILSDVASLALRYPNGEGKETNSSREKWTEEWIAAEASLAKALYGCDIDHLLTAELGSNKLLQSFVEANTSSKRSIYNDATRTVPANSASTTINASMGPADIDVEFPFHRDYIQDSNALSELLGSQLQVLRRGKEEKATRFSLALRLHVLVASVKVLWATRYALHARFQARTAWKYGYHTAARVEEQDRHIASLQSAGYRYREENNRLRAAISDIEMSMAFNRSAAERVQSLEAELSSCRVELSENIGRAARAEAVCARLRQEIVARYRSGQLNGDAVHSPSTQEIQAHAGYVAHLKAQAKALASVDLNVWCDGGTETMANVQADLEAALLKLGAAREELKRRLERRAKQQDEMMTMITGDKERSVVEGLSLCCICRDRARNILLLPCRHLCLCNACANASGSDEGESLAVNKCPVCRCHVSEKILIYD